MKYIIITFAFLLILPWSGRCQTASDDTVKLGLSLSGGAATGYAHLGVLQAFDEANIKIDVIAGTSMGAIIGVFYAAGFSPQEILELAKREKMNNIRHVVRPNHHRDGGFSDYKRLRAILYKYMPHNCFDSLNIPFYCCAADINHVKPVYRGHGLLLAQYVTASASMPLVFTPVKIDSSLFVDGGVLDNLPIEPLFAEGCNIRVGSYILHETPTSDLTINKKMRSRANVWLRSFSILSNSNMYARLPSFTHLIPCDPHNYNLADFDAIDSLYAYGYAAAKSMIAAHPELLLHHR